MSLRAATSTRVLPAAGYASSTTRCSTWVYASFLMASPRRPELARILEERLRWLRTFVGAA
jgi:hypothetical protein